VPHKISDETSGNNSCTSIENNTYILNIKCEHTRMYKTLNFNIQTHLANSNLGRSPKVLSIKNEQENFFEFYRNFTMIYSLAIKGLHWFIDLVRLISWYSNLKPSILTLGFKYPLIVYKAICGFFIIKNMYGLVLCKKM
jgi:hypothetical protein